MPYAYLGTFYNAQKGISKVSFPFCVWSAVMWVFYHNPSLGPIPNLKLTDSCLSDIWKATSQNVFFFLILLRSRRNGTTGLRNAGQAGLHLSLPPAVILIGISCTVWVWASFQVLKMYAFPVWGLAVSPLFYVSLLAWWHILWTWLHMCIIYAIRKLALCLPHYVAKHFSYFIIYYFSLFYFPVLNIL